MNIFKRLRDQPRWRVITAVIVVVVLAIGVTVVALLPRLGAPIATTQRPTDGGSTPATPTPTPPPEPGAPRTATADIESTNH